MEVVHSPPRLHNASNGIMNGGSGSGSGGRGVVNEEKKGSPENNNNNEESTTMKAAAELIQSLDNAYSEMKHSAVDAAKDAETARRNARAASEIARRYLHRTYPKVQTQFGAGPGTPTQRSKQQQQQLSSSSEESQKVITKNNADDPLREINGIASELQTPRNRHQYDHNNNINNSNSRYRQQTNIYSPPMSSDRLAQNHADDVLALTMELERTKQALKSEQRQHEESKASLASYKSKHQSLEIQNQKLLEELEITKRETQTRTNELEQELQKAKYNVQAAEDDAQLALDLAKDADSKNLQLEDDLKKAMDEIQILKQGIIINNGKATFETPKRAVRFADDSTATTTPQQQQQQEYQTLTPNSSSTPRSGGPSREMIATGRQLLRRRMGTSPEDEVITLELTPSKSAERRRRLKDRLSQQQQTLLLSDNIQTPQKSSSSPLQRSDNIVTNNTKLLDECRNSAKLLQQSGQRLDLGGHWWRDIHHHHQRGQQQQQQQKPHDIHLEVMTRQYCQSVEFSIERQRKEINELESLCGYLEKKIVTGK